MILCNILFLGELQHQLPCLVYRDQHQQYPFPYFVHCELLTHQTPTSQKSHYSTSIQNPTSVGMFCIPQIHQSVPVASSHALLQTPSFVLQSLKSSIPIRHSSTFVHIHGIKKTVCPNASHSLHQIPPFQPANPPFQPANPPFFFEFQSFFPVFDPLPSNPSKNTCLSFIIWLMVHEKGLWTISNGAAMDHSLLAWTN